MVITGASTGIGRAAAIHLAQKFNNLTVFAGVRKEKDAASIRDEKLTNLIPILLDVTKSIQIEAAAKIITDTNQPLVALINNAGTAISDAPIEISDLKRWRQLYDVNVFGLVAVTQKFLPLLRASRGRIINVGSIAGDIAQPMWSPYASSKHAVEAITDALRVEMRDFQISVSLIKPGEIKTNIFKKMGNIETGITTSIEDWTVEKSLQKIYDKSHAGVSKETFLLYQKGLKESIEFTHHVATKSDIYECPTVMMTNNAITHAIMSSWPRTRYVFGGGSALWVANLFLPDKITDVIQYWLFMQDGWHFFHCGVGSMLLKMLNVLFYW